MEEQGNPLVPKDNSLVGQDKNLVPQDASATGKKKPAKPRKKPNKENYAYDNRVKLYPDGKYHWIYELHLFKNPAVILEVVRALAITVGLVAILMLVLVTCEDGINIESTQTILKIVGLMVVILLGLLILAFPLYAALVGWKYTVHFIMDENGVEHQQTAKSKSVGKKISLLTALVGLLSRRPTVAGAGMLAASRTSMTSEFRVVRKVKAVRWMHLIMVNEFLSRNQVYVVDEDFDFVYDYISKHCPKAKIK